MSKKTNPARSWQSRLNNAQGQTTEKEVERACLHYKERGIALIDKTPEPFSVKEKGKRGRFVGQFGGKKAQPDFKGTIKGGRTVVFEVKSTQDDRIKQSVLTATQAELLEQHYRMGAIAFVCVALRNEYFTIPWQLWRDMKIAFGRKYIKAEEISKYKVRYSVGIMFFDKMELIDGEIEIKELIECGAQTESGKCGIEEVEKDNFKIKCVCRFRRVDGICKKPREKEI